MNIQGLDYNTQREKLILPEYGREIQKMVDHAVGLPTKAERQLAAETLIRIMDRMNPTGRDSQDRKQKLWDHLAIMSDFKLDIDYPFDVRSAHQITEKPQPLKYPMKRIAVKHYGDLVFQLCHQLENMPAGKQREELAIMTANQMKRDLTLWSHGSNSSEKVVDDLAYFTHGKVRLDPSKVKAQVALPKETEKKRKRR